MLGVLSKINNLFFKKKDDWHWNNPFAKGTEHYDLYQKGNDNYFKYLRNEIPTTIYIIEVWIEGSKLESNGWNRFYPRLVYENKEEA